MWYDKWRVLQYWSQAEKGEDTSSWWCYKTFFVGNLDSHKIKKLKKVCSDVWTFMKLWKQCHIKAKLYSKTVYCILMWISIKKVLEHQQLMSKFLSSSIIILHQLFPFQSVMEPTCRNKNNSNSNLVLTGAALWL